MNESKIHESAGPGATLCRKLVAFTLHRMQPRKTPLRISTNPQFVTCPDCLEARRVLGAPVQTQQ